MKFIYRWLNRKLTESSLTDNTDTKDHQVTSSRGGSFHDYQELESTPISFYVYKADGGHVVETRNYKKTSDHNSMYLVTPDQDFGQRIAHILTIEALL